MKLTNKTVILLILLIAIILRFINYFDIPFTHDEFSAMFRLNFDSFSELIEKGVKIDGHPAGIQVFLYYWTKLFGYQEWIVKLPFAIFGIISVYIIYLIGTKWFNETVGLLSAAYIGSIQFTIMYSQIARLYISGMFFSLLMIYYWSNLMMNPHKNFNRNSLLFIISTSLCTYNHHFSLLFAAIVGISGVFYIQRKYLIKYVISGITRCAFKI
ncbi:MAG: glycosyltransferase family 39 protein [Bacteroidales bacterium]|nr:glycosyltransferase family 39 protein [Bacteroidales bacterium]